MMAKIATINFISTPIGYIEKLLKENDTSYFTKSYVDIDRYLV